MAKIIKAFTEGQPVEIIPLPLGRRSAKPKLDDWKPATYRHRGKDEMRGWHFVTYGSSIIHVPTRRIRDPIAIITAALRSRR